MGTWRVSFSPAFFSYHRRANTVRPLRLLALVAVLVVLVVVACVRTDVTVTGTPDGTTAVVSGPDAPPIVVDKDGFREPPTPTPDRITPVYPITTPGPTKTPKPG
jgi:hypothetical protein